MIRSRAGSLPPGRWQRQLRYPVQRRVAPRHKPHSGMRYNRQRLLPRTVVRAARRFVATKSFSRLADDVSSLRRDYRRSLWVESILVYLEPASMDFVPDHRRNRDGTLVRARDRSRGKFNRVHSHRFERRPIALEVASRRFHLHRLAAGRRMRLMRQPRLLPECFTMGGPRRTNLCIRSVEHAPARRP